MNEEKKKLRKNPEESNFFLFNFFFTFMFRIVLGKKMTMDDVPDVAADEKSEKNFNKAQKYWRPKYEKYVELKEAYDKAKLLHPNLKIKEPETPSIMGLTLRYSFQFFMGQILAMLQGGIQLVQPYVVRWVLIAFNEKLNNPKVKPPYGWMAFLALAPLGLIFFDSNASRMTIHAIVKLRGAFCSMLYDKVLRLNLGNDSGFLISLISFDSRTATEKIQEFVMFFWSPFKILFVFGQIYFDIGYTSLIAPALVLISMPPQIFATRVMIKGYRNYLQTNDGRMKVTNESLQGMRVIKYGGLEDVFKEKILKNRDVQLAFCKTHVFGLVLMQSILHSVFILVQAVTLSSYIFINKVEQKDTVLKLFPLAQMINNLNILAAYIPNQIQGMLQVSICMRRIRTFLMIDEHKEYVVTDNPNMTAHVDITVPQKDKITADLPLAVLVEGGACFKWAPPPKIPLTPEQMATAARVEQERLKQQKREAREAERRREREAKARKEREKERKKKGREGEDDDVGFGYSINEDEGEIHTERTSLLSGSSGQPSYSSGGAAISSGFKAEKEKDTTPSSAPSASPTPTPTPSYTPGGTPASRPTTIRSLDLAVPKGSLVMVVGTVGSGKSSLLSVVIGDIVMIDPVTAAAILAASGPTPLTGEGDGSTRGNELARDRAAAAASAAFGGSRLPRVSVTGRVAYFAQSAWIFNETVRGNILFGLPYDAARYEEAVRICCLRSDFESLAGGDMTMIGEKGVNLSGGQKARVQLARCVYSDSDVYLLDDPLSAVDAHVGKTIFEECIVKTLQARGKTVLLATNQLRFLSEADCVVVVDHGAMLDMGRLEELESRGLHFEQTEKKQKPKNKGGAEVTTQVVKVHKKKHAGDDEGETRLRVVSDAQNVVLPRSLTDPSRGKAPAAEGDGITPNPASPTPAPSSSSSDSASSSSSSSASGAGAGVPASKHSSSAQEAAKSLGSSEEASAPYAAIKMPLKYVATYGNIIIIIIYFLFLFSGEFLLCMGTYWMGVVGDTERFKWIKYHYKLYVWMSFYVVAQIIYASRAAFYSAITKRSNNFIHRALLSHVFRAPISWVDSTPLGRLINRFSADVTQSDTVLHTSFAFVQHCWCTVVGLIACVCSNTPWLLVVAFPCIVFYHIIAFLYAPVAQNLQSLEGVARSPVMSLFEETITGAGLPTLRSAGKQDLWKQTFFKRLDRWGETYALVRTGQKWCSLYASLVSTVLMSGVQVFGWMYMRPSELGVGVTAIMISTYQSMFLIENFVDFESSLTNFERVQTYSYNLPQEMDPPTNQIIKPPPAWPTHGEIQFDNVAFRYRPGLPFVLKDVSFVIEGGQKVGVCGRTGAGKTSILYALFRLVELDPQLMPVYVDRLTGKRVRQGDPNEEPNHGRILVDSLDISQTAMRRARSSIAIIPQDPTLFTGTLRYNLDLKSACKDEEIWSVLDLIEMRQPVLEMGEEGLDIQVQEGGLNFSCGQRQLICLGRALLNNCRIIVLDEATANIDVETDAKIQTIIRERFTDKTAIVIAHRLHTIIGFDKIMVMDDGHLAEYDSPQKLMADENSLFSQLLRASRQKKGDGEEKEEEEE